MEVEHEHERAALEDEDLTTVVGGAHVLVRGAHVRAYSRVQRHHRLVKAQEVAVTQVIGVGEIPAAAAVLVTPVVTLAREVDPLGMTELVTRRG